LLGISIKQNIIIWYFFLVSHDPPFRLTSSLHSRSFISHTHFDTYSY